MFEVFVFQDCLESICTNISDEKDISWIRIDARPMKLIATAYAKLIMWTYTQFLSEQVLPSLNHNGNKQYIMDSG